MSALDRLEAALAAHGCDPKRRGDHLDAKCPAHDDRIASLTADLKPGLAVMKCHAGNGCVTESVVAALDLTMADLFDQPFEKDSKPEITATYDYTDEHGTLLYQVVRYSPKSFKQRQPDGHGGWEWNLRGVARVPYRLPELIAGIEAGRWIVIDEGERDCDRLIRAGFVATCNAGGAGKWLASWAPYFTGAKVAILCDNDDVGRRHGEQVAASLVGIAEIVKVIELPGLPAHGDVSDWLDSGGTSDELKKMILSAAEWLSGLEVSAPSFTVLSGGKSGDEDDEDTRGTRRSQASKLVSYALEHYRLGRAEDGAAFAVELGGSNIAKPLRGRNGLRAELARAYFAMEQTAPSAQGLADALGVLEGFAASEEREGVALRVGSTAEGLVLDLGTPSGQAVDIRPGWWEVVDRSPVLFRRTELVGALPLPSSSGDLGLLRRLVNVTDADWPLLVGYLVSTLLPAIPHPIPAFTGEQGAAKTTTASLVVRSVDPGPAPLRTAPRDPEGWIIAAAGSWMVALDNVSAVPPWLSDALCRAVTGDGLVRRSLYSDGDLAVTAFRRCVLLTTIDAGALRGDLAERLLPIRCERIKEENRRLDAEVECQFVDAQPVILGGLLDLTAQVLGALTTVELEKFPRMADFAKILAAVDRVTGWASLDRYLETTWETVASVIEDDIVAQAVISYVNTSYEGTATELLKAIIPDHPGKDWPTTGRGLSGRLRRLAPALREAGLEVYFGERDGHDRRRVVRLVKTQEGVREGPSALSAPPALAADQEERIDNPADDIADDADMSRATVRDSVHALQCADQGQRSGADGRTVRTVGDALSLVVSGADWETLVRRIGALPADSPPLLEFDRCGWLTRNDLTAEEVVEVHRFIDEWEATL